MTCRSGWSLRMGTSMAAISRRQRSIEWSVEIGQPQSRATTGRPHEPSGTPPAVCRSSENRPRGSCAEAGLSVWESAAGRLALFAPQVSLRRLPNCVGESVHAHIVETLFGKMARTFLRHVRVQSWEELRARILKGVAENQCRPSCSPVEEVRRSYHLVSICFIETTY